MMASAPVHEHIGISLRPQQSGYHQVAAFAAFNLAHGIRKLSIERGCQHEHGWKAGCQSNVWTGINVDTKSIGETKWHDAGSRSQVHVDICEVVARRI